MSGHRCIELAGRIELGFGLEAYPIHSVATTSGILRGGSRGWLGWLVTSPPGAATYFMLLLCVWQTHKRLNFILDPVSPDPLNARSLRSLGFPKSPPLKILGPPMILPKITVLFFGTSQQVDHRNVFSTLPRKTWTLIAGRRPVYRTERPPLCTAQCVWGSVSRGYIG